MTRSPQRRDARAPRSGRGGASGVSEPTAAPSESGLLGPVEVRSIAGALGIRPTKTLGQNFVHDAGTVRRIVRAGGVRAGDEVLEVGPGLGSLTLALLEAGARVRAVEIDAALARALPTTVAGRMPEAAGRLRVIHADAMRIRGPQDLRFPLIDEGGSGGAARESGAVLAGGESGSGGAVRESGAVLAGGLSGAEESEGGDGSRGPGWAGLEGPDGRTSRDWADWPDPTRLVANLPYNVAVPVLLSLLERLPSLADVLVMVQSEVADRLSAGPGSRTYGVPSVKAAWYGTAERVGTIGRTVFWPAPNVDSALVRLRRAPEPPGDDALRRATFEVVDVAFGQRRKTLRAALRQWAGAAETAEDLLRAAGIDPVRRGETLTVDEFVALGRQTLAARARGELAETPSARAAGSDPEGTADPEVGDA